MEPESVMTSVRNFMTWRVFLFAASTLPYAGLVMLVLWAAGAGVQTV